MEKRKAWIFDMDGTIVNIDSIYTILNEMMAQDPQGLYLMFKEYHEKALDCPPNQEVVQMLLDAKKDFDILIVTARGEEYKAETSLWLEKNNIPYDALFMRPAGSLESDANIKNTIYLNILNDWDVEHAVDDNPDIIKLWGDYNIPTTKYSSQLHK